MAKTVKLNNWDTIQTGLGMTAGIASSMSGGRPSAGKGALSGAATGAAMGSTIGPWGTVIGAGLGGTLGAVKGSIGANQAQQDYLVRQNLITRMNQNKTATLAQDSSFLNGDEENGFYKFGGQIGSLNPNGLEKLADGSYAVNGPSHEQGGVQVGPNELEGGETIAKGYVFSEELGFAKEHKPIAKRIGYLEEKSPSPLRNKTLKSLKAKELELAQTQEIVKQQLGL